MARRRAGYLAAGYPYIVAEAEGRLLGYAYVSAYRPRPAYRFSVENSIYIDQEARRGGIGSALLPVLIERCTALGFRQMIAVIGDSNQAPSIELHRALGFRLIGTIENVGFKFDRWLDTVLMQRPLGPATDTSPEP
jgi:phosphinothricin acetyltransferase